MHYRSSLITAYCFQLTTVRSWGIFLTPFARAHVDICVVGVVKSGYKDNFKMRGPCHDYFMMNYLPDS